MSAFLRTRLMGTPAMLAVFSDEAVFGHALAFEAALARAEAAADIMPHTAADAIINCCKTIVFDPAVLAEEMVFAGTLAIPLVQKLRAALPPEAASFVHKGATSQDLADTVLVRQSVAAAKLLAADLNRICTVLRDLAAAHATRPAIGRTLLQDALPISFGLRLAQALAGIEFAAKRLEAEIAAHAKIQFGGAAGTRAGLGGKGSVIALHMAQELGLANSVPWHACRTGIAAIAAALGIVIGALGKLARDISLLAQNSVGELREPAIKGRGGSSAMAHKRNPTGCQVALSACLRAPGLVAGILSGLPAEQERGLGGWQAEGPALADLFLIASASAEALSTVAAGLEIDQAAIARNLENAGIGNDIGESAVIVTAILTHQGE